MSILPRLLGMAFKSKVDRLEMAFAAAGASFRAEVELVERDAVDFQQKVEAGEAAWEQTTDDGYHYSYGDDLVDRRDEANDALSTLRTAFTFLIYHQWERSAQRWTRQSGSPNHAELVNASKAAGIPLDEPGLETMRLLVNTLKHNSATAGSQLHTRRSDLFDPTFDPNANHPLTGKPPTAIDWADQVRLTDENMDEFIEVVRKSALL